MLGVGILGAWLHEPRVIAGKILHIPGVLEKLTEALLVAAVLALTVDAFLKREFAEEVIKKVAPYFVGYGLPDKVIHELEWIRDIQVYMDGMQLDFELEECGKSDRLLLRITSSYNVRNRSTVEQSFIHSLACQRPKDGECTNLQSAGANGVVLKGSPELKSYLYDEIQLGDQIEMIRSNPLQFPPEISELVKDDELWRSWAKQIWVRPEQPGQQVFPRLWGISTQEVALDGYHPHFFSRPVKGLTYSIKSRVSGIKMSVFVGHRGRQDATPSGEDTYSLDVAFLPWQGLMVKWWKTV